MEEKPNIIEPLFEKIEQYGKISYQLLKLEALEKTAKLISELISSIIVWVCLLLFIITLNIGLALWLGELLGRTYYGFFCVAGLYLVIAGTCHFILSEKIKTRISNQFIISTLN